MFQAAAGPPPPQQPETVLTAQRIPNSVIAGATRHIAQPPPMQNTGLVADLCKIIERQSQEIANLVNTRTSGTGAADGTSDAVERKRTDDDQPSVKIPIKPVPEFEQECEVCQNIHSAPASRFCCHAHGWGCTQLSHFHGMAGVGPIDRGRAARRAPPRQEASRSDLFVWARGTTPSPAPRP